MMEDMRQRNTLLGIGLVLVVLGIVSFSASSALGVVLIIAAVAVLIGSLRAHGIDTSNRQHSSNS
ncbi:hypothetical protein [Rudaeicoccus suwonensis]|uniref:Uncharacterized protein n=1 Tax=Rudaeicoccus suwonensis TaxID=657409 RepID=A0A561E3B7_9MICO|nr:hypothetical protein [Rudaeicoccus suwonensis]TWE10105.1 hypothetical protein BKA23_2456 [Rudaeicoccus suwonensis]